MTGSTTNKSKDKAPAESIEPNVSGTLKQLQTMLDSHHDKITKNILINIAEFCCKKQDPKTQQLQEDNKRLKARVEELEDAIERREQNDQKVRLEIRKQIERSSCLGEQLTERDQVMLKLKETNAYKVASWYHSKFSDVRGQLHQYQRHSRNLNTEMQVLRSELKSRKASSEGVVSKEALGYEKMRGRRLSQKLARRRSPSTDSEFETGTDVDDKQASPSHISCCSSQIEREISSLLSCFDSVLPNQCEQTEENFGSLGKIPEIVKYSRSTQSETTAEVGSRRRMMEGSSLHDQICDTVQTSMKEDSGKDRAVSPTESYTPGDDAHFAGRPLSTIFEDIPQLSTSPKLKRLETALSDSILRTETTTTSGHFGGGEKSSWGDLTPFLSFGQVD